MPEMVPFTSFRVTVLLFPRSHSIFVPMPDTITDFNAFRSRMNDLILGAGNLTLNRFFALDQRAYEPGALGTKTKEMLGLVASLVLRCDDCVTYHVVRCHEEGVTREEFLEVFSVGLVVGGSIVIPHLRRAMARLEELEGPPSPAGSLRCPTVRSTPAMMSAAPTAWSGRGRSPEQQGCGNHRHQRREAHVDHRAARPHRLHAPVPDHVGHQQREHRRVGQGRPALPPHRAPIHPHDRRQAGDQQRGCAGDRRHHGDPERRDSLGHARRPSV